LGNLFLIGFNPSPELKVITGFIALVIHFGLVALLGRMLGTALAFVIEKFVRNTNATANALRLGIWIPVIGMWAVPVPLVSLLATLAVTAATCYYHLTVRSLLFLDPQQTKSLVTAETILHALLITLLIQLLEPGFGWFAVYESYGLLKALGTLIFVLFTLYVVSTTMRSNFIVTAEVHSKIAEEFVSTDSRSSLSSTIIVGAVFAVVWQTLSWYGLDAWISSPWSVLKVAIRGLSSDYYLWRDIAPSLAEICLGLAVSGGIALYLREFLSSLTTMQSSPWRFLYLTHITPIVFLPLLIHWRILRGFWVATACVGLLSFFPLFRVLSGLTGRSAKFKFILGSLEALPYAFVAMLFGETMHSFGGLGFTLTSATGSRGSPAEAMAIVLIIVLLMTSMAWLLKYLARTEQRISD
jgi:hypothetical protein